jgi:hypothetical protein
MSWFSRTARVLAGSIAIGLIGAALITTAAAQEKAAPPDFSSNFAGWVGFNGGGPFYEPVPGRIPPVVSDPAHPFVANGTRAQPTYRIPDLSNPNLKPWVKELMKKDSDGILAGKKAAFTPQSSCWPAGVPFFMGYGGADPLVFLQTPRKVWILWREDNQSRQIHMDVPHSSNLKPSWYGESVGHYEGDALVVDTIGFNARTVVDVYRTPHTEKLHVVERWRMVDNGNTLEVLVTIDDSDTYNQPWQGLRRYRRTQGQLGEQICAEGNFLLFDYGIPVAKTPDF